MKKIAIGISVLLLLLNGTGAFFGSFQLITDPTGTKLQLPLSYLEPSPFSNYLIPGIILFICNGLFSFIALEAIIRKRSNQYWLVIAQGCLLTGWIIGQISLLRMFYPPWHLTFLLIGICLIGCGLYLKKHKT